MCVTKENEVKDMTTITLKVSEADKKFMQAIAKFEGVSLSELIRTKTLEAIEEEYDARVADLALAEYEAYLENGGEVLNWDDL